MFIVTAKLSMKKLLLGILAVALLIVLIIYLVPDREDPVAMWEGGLNTLTAEVSAAASGVKTADDRLEYIHSWGWEVDPEPEEEREAKIPNTFDSVYQKYNEIQKEQGLDLEKYKGKRVNVYTYLVKNHPTGEDGVRLTLIVYKDKVIGGDVASARLDGFMHGFKMPESADSSGAAGTVQDTASGALSDAGAAVEGASPDVLPDAGAAADTAAAGGDAASPAQ